MKHVPLLIAFIVPLAMIAACSSLTGPATRLDQGRALIAAEAGVDAAAIAADTAVKAGLTTPAQNAALAALTPQVEVALSLARAAYAAGDFAGEAAEVASLATLAVQLDAAH